MSVSTYFRNGFSKGQVLMLREQISQAFQLTTQACVIERELSGKKDGPVGYWEAQMVCLWVNGLGPILT